MDLTALRVLLVEDNDLDARIMIRALREISETKFEVLHVTTTAGALDTLGHEAVDCILLDLTLPDSSELAGLRAVMEAAPQAPIVVLTGLDDPATAVEAVELGAHDYLPKNDVDGSTVARAIRYAVARHHAETDLRAANERLRLADDRERIAQDLHDTVVQQLFATGMGLQALSARLSDADMRAALLDSVDNIDAAIRQLREAIFDLHVASESRVGDEFDEVIDAERSALGFEPVVTKQGLSGVPDEVRREAAAVVREALSNVAKHARATAVEVTIRADGSALSVEVADDGIGCPPLDGRRTFGRQGHGTVNMTNRAHGLGGEFRIVPAAGGGTIVHWRVPLSRS